MAIRNQKQLYWIIGLAVLTILFLAYEDTLGFAMFDKIGGFQGDAYSKVEMIYQQMFWLFATALITVISIVYYLFRKDLSETIAVILSYKILLLGGLEDVLYFIIQGINIPSELPWLDKSLMMGFISRMMNQVHVTSTSLIISVMVSIVILYFVIRWLKNVNYSVWGIKI